MKIAIVIDWLVVYAGAERVIEQMVNCYPDADLFSIVDHIPSQHRGFLQNKESKVSFIQKLPFSKKLYRSYLPLMPFAVEQFDLTPYEIVISCSHAVAKGVITGPDQLHICMCYTPIRYAWDLQFQYLKETGLDKGLKGLIARYFLYKIRIWDVRTANGVDEFIAISKFIKRRITKVYRRDSIVLYPPVDVESFELCADKDDYYLTASRLVPYKQIGLIADAFTQMPDKKLLIIGDGPEFDRISEKAGSNIEMLGYQSKQVLTKYLQQAKAFVFAAEEDFGIAPLEAQSCGTPVIAYGKGGALETIKGIGSEEPTGIFFQEQVVESIIGAVKSFEESAQSIKTLACRNNALRFSQERFRKEFSTHIENAWAEFNKYP